MTESTTREQERAAAVEQLQFSEAARQALQNEAIMAYFREAEAKAIDALLGAAITDDLGRLRLATVAQTVRNLISYLQQGRDLGDFARSIIADIDKEDANRER